MKKCNYNVFTFQKCNYKIITKTILYYIVITFSLSAQAVILPETILDGQLIIGQAEAGEKIFVKELSLNIGKNNNSLFQIPLDPSGQFVIATPQDASELILTVQDATHSKEMIFPVQSRIWKEEIVTGLPPAKVQPNQKNQERITREALEMRSARQQSTYPNFPQNWIRPVKNYTRISSEFGSRRILNNIKKQGHSGTDYAAPIGTPVQAPLPGRVALVNSDFFLTGKTVLIDHGYGVFSSYSHLNQIDVQEGQILQQGDIIGQVGQTGRATGPHLHFTVTWYGIRVNPEDLFD